MKKKKETAKKSKPFLSIDTLQANEEVGIKVAHTPRTFSSVKHLDAGER